MVGKSLKNLLTEIRPIVKSSYRHLVVREMIDLPGMASRTTSRD